MYGLRDMSELYMTSKEVPPMTTMNVILRLSRMVHLDADDLLAMPITDALKILSDLSRIANRNYKALAAWLYHVWYIDLAGEDN